MVRDIGDACTAWDVFHSEEAQWLRQACSRNRARIVAMACQHLNIPFPAMLDYTNALQGEKMAIICTEAIHHELKAAGNEMIQVLNYCAGLDFLNASLSSL